MGFWGKGNNPFFNHDFDAAQRDREAHRASETAHKERLAHELDLQTQRLDSDAALSKLRIQKNAMEAQYKGKIKAYEAQIVEMRKAFYDLGIRCQIYEKTINDVIAKNPDMGEDILDDMQTARDFCTQPEYKQKWWDYLHKVTIELGMEYLKFPYVKREPKK